MFSLSAQQSYSSLANSPAAILSACMQYSQHGYHKALLSSVPLTGFASIVCQYHTALREPNILSKLKAGAALMGKLLLSVYYSHMRNTH